MINYKIQELVSPHIYQALGDHAFSLFDSKFLEDVDKFTSDIKKDLGVKSVTINNWLWNGNFTQSGFREHNTSVGAPKSAHKTGKALDLKFNGCTVAQALDYLLKNQVRYPNIRRVEDLSFTPTWLHVDSVDRGHVGIHIFKP